MIIIFGASGGLGECLVEHFRSIDQDVIGTFNSKIPVEVNGMFKIDVTNFEEVNSFISGLNIIEPLYVVNCTGITDACPLHKTNFDSWKKVIDVNLMGAFNIARAVLPVMREHNFGRIINFGSIVAKRPVFGSSAYISSKAALIGLSKAINIENARLGVSAATINLGYSEKGMIERVPASIMDGIVNSSPLKRLCSTDEIITTVQFVFDCEYVGGSEIDLFGGI